MNKVKMVTDEHAASGKKVSVEIDSVYSVLVNEHNITRREFLFWSNNHYLEQNEGAKKQMEVKKSDALNRLDAISRKLTECNLFTQNGDDLSFWEIYPHVETIDGFEFDKNDHY